MVGTFSDLNPAIFCTFNKNIKMLQKILWDKNLVFIRLHLDPSRQRNLYSLYNDQAPITAHIYRTRRIYGSTFFSSGAGGLHHHYAIKIRLCDRAAFWYTLPCFCLMMLIFCCNGEPHPNRAADLHLQDTPILISAGSVEWLGALYRRL